MKDFLTYLSVTATVLVGLFVCGCQTQNASGTAKERTTNLLKIDAGAWRYNAEDNVYYQTGIAYCENPADTDYETLAVFVPGSYFTGTSNGDDTYTCTINQSASVGNYTAQTAPIVMPINTPGYSAQKALNGYTSVIDYINAGFVYVHAGCRGRDAGAPAGVTDLKAAIRYLRYSAAVLPGNTERIFTFGMSGGGAQSAVMGATGNSSLYDAYLTQIGAVQGVSDAVFGSMCWCPITNLDSADAAYEWMMGSTRSGLSTEEQKISDSLAAAYALYVNNSGIQDTTGKTLTLIQSPDGIYQAGSYYDYLLREINRSLNNFLADTPFPYNPSSAAKRGGMRRGTNMPPLGEMPNANIVTGQRPAENGAAADIPFEARDNIQRKAATGGITLSGTYNTAQEYIDALNQRNKWVTYDAATNTATVSSIAAFVSACKNASKNLAAFDQLNGGQGENTLFGYGDGKGAHFDAVLADILQNIGSRYAADYANDLAKTDTCGNTAAVRLNMYTPLYYLLKTQAGYRTSEVAQYWRIRTGLAQGDCALSTEVNLALALANYSRNTYVDFETIWGAGHTMAERTGDSTANFITWVNTCMSNHSK